MLLDSYPSVTPQGSQFRIMDHLASHRAGMWDLPAVAEYILEHIHIVS